VAELDSPTTLPVGFGGATPVVTKRALERGDRVLFFTDAVTEKDRRVGAELGKTSKRPHRAHRYRRRAGSGDGAPSLPRPDARTRRGYQLRRALLLIEWRVGSADYLANIDKPSR